MAFSAAPLSVSDQDGELPQLDAAALADVERGWTHAADRLHIKVGPGDQQLVIVP